MNADPRTVLLGIAAALAFVVCVVVVIVAHQTTGWPSLIAMLAGLAGLITLLALYNRGQR